MRESTPSRPNNQRIHSLVRNRYPCNLFIFHRLRKSGSGHALSRLYYYDEDTGWSWTGRGNRYRQEHPPPSRAADRSLNETHPGISQKLQARRPGASKCPGLRVCHRLWTASEIAGRGGLVERLHSEPTLFHVSACGEEQAEHAGPLSLKTVLSGKSTYIIDGREVSVVPGRILIVPEVPVMPPVSATRVRRFSPFIFHADSLARRSRRCPCLPKPCSTALLQIASFNPLFLHITVPSTAVWPPCLAGWRNLQSLIRT